METELGRAIAGYLKVMSSLRDPELRILKAHLLAEKEMTKYLEQELARPDSIPERVKFADRLWVARAITKPDQSEDWIWDALGVLNKLRNDLAHELDPPKHKKHWDTLRGLVKKSELWAEPGESATTAQRESQILLIVCCELSNRLTAKAIWAMQVESIKIRLRGDADKA